MGLHTPNLSSHCGLDEVAARDLLLLELEVEGFRVQLFG